MSQRRTFDLSAEGKMTVVAFLSAECPCSKSHIEHLRELKERNPELQFVGVLSNAEEDVSMAAVILNQIGFPVLVDEDQALANAFGAVKTPHIFVVKSGEIVFHGGISDASHFANAKVRYLETALAQIKLNKTPRPNYARALGCDIRRR